MSRDHSQSILIIDDDPIFCSRLARAFRDRGLLVKEATNSTAAYQLIQSFRPKRVVLDLKLAKESGLVILKELMHLDPRLKIVVLTGYGTITTAVEAVKLGAINYITKPIDSDSILAAFDISPKTKSGIDAPQLAQVEWDHIQRVIHDCGGNITQASKVLGLHRRSLQRKLAKTPNSLR
jgi:two-component system, response regulator RegA